MKLEELKHPFIWQCDDFLEFLEWMKVIRRTAAACQGTTLEDSSAMRDEEEQTNQTCPCSVQQDHRAVAPIELADQFHDDIVTYVAAVGT